jgi:hypothetical protein
MNGYFKCFAYFVLSLAAILIIYIGFNLVYPYPTMTVESPATVLNKTVHPGEVLQVRINCEKFTDNPAVVTRQFINDIVYVMPSYTSNYVKGKHDTISLSTKVPSELPPGEYYVRTTLSYSFPPFRTIIYTFDTERFTVVK